MLMDNYYRKVCAEKIVQSLDSLNDGKLVYISYFLLSYLPYHDLGVLNDYSLRLHSISEKVKST